jgi:uncharacterized cupin superfamily protein
VAEHIVHWDELESEHAEAGPISSHWTDLGTAAGARHVRLNRIGVDPGKRSTPLHVEADEEEIFFVLSGSGLAWQRVGDEDVTFEVRAGDCLVHLAGKEAHTLIAGDDGLDVLAYGIGPDPVLTYFPRLNAVRVGPALVDVDGRHQWPLEGALPDPDLPAPGPRPSRVVNVDEVERERGEDRPPFGEDWQELAGRAGSVRAGLNVDIVWPGRQNCPLHCHSAEEELFVVLDGAGTLLLGDEEIPVRRGHVISRPAGTRVAHAFRAGDAGLTVLLYGTREPNDIAYYPKSNKIYFRGVGVITRVDRLDYWDGEEDSARLD